VRDTLCSYSFSRSLLLIVVGLVVSACGGGDGGDTGVVSLAVTDAPVDEVSSVVVQFSGVAFKREGSEPETVSNLTPTPRQIDLLQFSEGRAAVLLDGVTLPAGHYEWVRLIVDNQPNVRDSFVELLSGAECELRVPSGAESGLKLNRGFTLPADGSVALTVDFNLLESILHAPPGQVGTGIDCDQGYLLRPTLRLVDNAEVGAIAGSVDAALVTEGCIPKVYIFAGAGAVADDIETTSAVTPDVDPLQVANVNVVNGATQYSYRAAFMPAGDYTVAFTCTADDPVNDETLTFSAAQNTTVQTNLISTVNFAAAP
jgi:hypothetical protein